MNTQVSPFYISSSGVMWTLNNFSVTPEWTGDKTQPESDDVSHFRGFDGPGRCRDGRSRYECSNTSVGPMKKPMKSSVLPESRRTTHSALGEQNDAQISSGDQPGSEMRSKHVDELKLHHGDTVDEGRSKPNARDENEAAMLSFGQQKQAGYHYPPVRLPKPPDKRGQRVDGNEEWPHWITRRGAEKGDVLDDQSRRGEEERTWLRRVNGHCVTQVTHHMLQCINASRAQI
jgi:hypothetical protein